MQYVVQLHYTDDDDEHPCNSTKFVSVHDSIDEANRAAIKAEILENMALFSRGRERGSAYLKCYFEVDHFIAKAVAYGREINWDQFIDSFKEDREKYLGKPEYSECASGYRFEVVEINTKVLRKRQHRQALELSKHLRDLDNKKDEMSSESEKDENSDADKSEKSDEGAKSDADKSDKEDENSDKDEASESDPELY